MKINLTTEGDKYSFLTVQGEGKYTGVLTTFIRLNYCNLACEWQNPDGTTTKCDTPHSSWYSNKENLVAEIDDVLSEVKSKGAEHVVITGGEPLLQEQAYIQLANGLIINGHYITTETNGTAFVQIPKGSHRVMMSISPKLSTSTFSGSEHYKRHESRRYNPDILKKLMSVYDYQFKFVANTPEDIEEIISKYIEPLSIPRENVYLMPQGVTTEQLNQRAQWIIEQCKLHGWNFSYRVHVAIYGARKGV